MTTPIADMVEQMFARDTPVDVILLAIRTLETSRDASHDERTKAAERARNYRMRRKHKEGGMAAPAPQQASRDASRTECDGALLLTSSFLPLEKGKSVEVRKKKERAPRKIAMPLPDDWRPTEAHHAKARDLKLAPGCLEGKIEDMRIWAQSNDIRKHDWNATFHGFLRRAATETGGANGHRGSRPLQDDSKSISRAAGQLAQAAERGEFTFGPRPSLLPETNANVVQLLPKG